MAPAEFDVVSQKGVLEARRVQVPLILAWALSIHKGAYLVQVIHDLLLSSTVCVSPLQHKASRYPDSK